MEGKHNKDDAWKNFQRRMDKLSSEATKKMEMLKNLDLFVLDNSIRETTIASLKAHTVAGMNRPNQETLIPDWLITSHVT